MFEMMLMRSSNSNVIPYPGKIGIYGMSMAPGPTSDEVYLSGGVTVDETQGGGLWLWNGRLETYTNLGTLPATVNNGLINALGVVDNSLYFVTHEYINSYDTLQKRWSSIPGLPYGSFYNFYGNGSVTYGGSMYFYGPDSTGTGNKLKRYDHVNNTWSIEKDHTGTSGGVYNKGILIGNVAYFIGGFNDNIIVKYNFTTKVFTNIQLDFYIRVNPCLNLYNGKILITPMDAPGQPKYSSDGKLIMMLDPATDTLTQIAETNPPKLTAATVVVGNKLKAYGGQDKTTSKPVPTVQSITVGPPADSSETIPVLETIALTTATTPVRNFRYSTDETLGRIWINRGVTIGAQNSTWLGYYNTVTDAWVPQYNWTGSPLSSTATFYNGKIYFFSDANIWVYDTVEGTLVKPAATTGYAFGPYIAPAFTYKNEVYQVGPTYTAGTTYEVVKYNPVTNARTFISRSPAALTNGDMSAILVGDWICVCGSGGSDAGPRRVYCYNLATNVWREITLRIDVAANPTLVTDGKTFSVLGGTSSQGNLGDVWAIDPNTGFSWKTGKLVPIKRNGAAILTDGNVVFYGGETQAIPSTSPTVITFKYPVQEN